MSNNWNFVKTTVLLASLTALFVLIGSALGGQGGMIFAFIFAIAMNMGTWWFSDKIALTMSRARTVSEHEMPELHRLMLNLSRRANIPKPIVYLIDSNMPNAFATGRSPEKAAVAVTTGLLALLNSEEVAGVIAHELAHIKHRDTLISSVAATLAGAISMIADLAMWGLMLGGFGSPDDEDGSVTGVIGGFLTLMLAPFVALIIQLAISRSREFSADAGGVQIMGSPLPLANALHKLEAYAQQGQPMQVNPATSHLYIVNPLKGGLIGLFRTHPPTEERIARLKAMNIVRENQRDMAWA